jgi:hypothetical protein
MPRIAVCLNHEDIDKPNFSGENDYLDYCAQCYADIDEADIAEDYKVSVFAVDRIDDEHPPYEGEDYSCTECGKTLTGRDD